jgi:hypothetical protein
VSVPGQFCYEYTCLGCTPLSSHVHWSSYSAAITVSFLRTTQRSTSKYKGRKWNAGTERELIYHCSQRRGFVQKGRDANRSSYCYIYMSREDNIKKNSCDQWRQMPLYVEIISYNNGVHYSWPAAGCKPNKCGTQRLSVLSNVDHLTAPFVIKCPNFWNPRKSKRRGWYRFAIQKNVNLKVSL